MREDSGEENMRLLIRFAKQSHYELLRRLSVNGNRHILEAIEAYKRNSNGDQFGKRLEKVASYYRAKEDLEEPDPIE